MSTSTDQLRVRAHRLIPGGAHTYSKGDDQFPANAPAFIDHGQGCTLWDNEGRQWLDWGMGLRSVILGHAYPTVVEAVQCELGKGSNFTRPAMIEAELAETFLSLFPHPDDLMVKFAKDGSDVTSAAVRLARAWTGRDIIVAIADNPFYSFNDWWIGVTEMNAGVPAASVLTTETIYYSNRDTLEDDIPWDHVAAIIVEPAATAPDGIDHGAYLRQMQDIAHQHGALFIMDEMITGFRWALPGAQTFYGVQPDLSCFGKAMGNGFSVAALVGRREIMELGGILQKERPRVFLLSATHGGETHALAAAMAVIREMQEQPVIEHIWGIGEALQNRLIHEIDGAIFLDYIRVGGYPCSPTLSFANPELRTLFLQEMCRQDILIPWIAPSYSHNLADIDRTVGAADAAMDVCKLALANGFDRYLEGPAVRPVFRRWN